MGAAAPRRVSYGIREWDLGSVRDEKRIEIGNARFAAVVNVPNAATLKLGSPNNSALDLQTVRAFRIPEDTRTAYLTNAASSGTLEILLSSHDMDVVQDLNSVSINTWGGTAQSGVDVAAKIDELEDALESVGTDELRENLTHVGGTAQSGVDIASKIDDLEDALASVGTDELRTTSADGTQSARETTATNTAAVSHADGPVEIVADTSGAATLTVEVSQDGGSTWDEYTVSIADSSGAKETVHGFADVRASVDQNLNALVLSAKGVGG